MATKIKKIKQDADEIQAMIAFYGQTYSEVYLVRDIKADCIIAVECAPANNTGPIVERANGRKRNIFGYGGLFMTTRLRLDTNEAGQRMVGYESASGNDTRLAAVERGEVPVTTGKEVALGGPGAIRTLSPFERAQIQSTVRQKQSASKNKADYEAYVNSAGNAVERFETFEVERVK